MKRDYFTDKSVYNQIETLVNQHGTPLYIYDGDMMSYQYHRLKNAFENVDLQLNFACKSLSNINVLSLFNSLGSGLDAVSLQEVKLGLMAGFSSEKIMYTPSGVEFSQFEEVVNLGCHVTLDNLLVLEQFGKRFGDTYSVAIRINPHVVGGGNSNISTGFKGSKFGISIDNVEDIIEIVNKYHINVSGLHLHTGSDILNSSAFIKSAEVMYSIAMNFDNLQFLDFGSGFKVAYKPGDYETDIEDLGKQLSKNFIDFCSKYGRKLKLIFEPGKFLVSQSGYFATKVSVVKDNGTGPIVGVNSGSNHLIRPMFYNAYHHIANISNPQGPINNYSVVGYLCETDNFALNRDLNEVRVGDILLFYNAGAYGFSMSSNYNSQFRPAEVLMYGGQNYLIRRRENFEDLISTQIPLDIF